AMPKSIEHYQQETGRAGRDGLEAECALLYSAADAMLWKSMFERPMDDVTPDPQFVATAVRHLNDIDRYCSGVVCRHRALVEYFGQRYSQPSCTACDICLGETQDVAEALIVAQKILSCVVRVGQSFGVGYVVSVLRGESNDRVVQRRHDQLSTYGLLKDYGKNEIRDWIWQLIVPPYVICSDRTRRAGASTRPTALLALRAIYGIGDAKLDAFGRAVLEVVAATPS